MRIYLPLLLSLFWCVPCAQAMEWTLPDLTVDADFAGEDRGQSVFYPGEKIEYLAPEAQSRHEVVLREGKFYWKDSQTLVHTEGTAMFVEDSGGRMLMSLPEEHQHFHHSSLVSGKPVRFAGEVEMQGGRIKLLTNFSGHYMPNLDRTYQYLRWIESRGADMRHARFKLRLDSYQAYLSRNATPETLEDFCRYSLDAAIEEARTNRSLRWLLRARAQDIREILSQYRDTRARRFAQFLGIERESLTPCGMESRLSHFLKR